MPDVIVTGLPRSGATVVAALVDGLPNAVCLNSPKVQITRARQQHELMPYCKWLAGDFVWQRGQFLRGEPVSDFRAADGSPLMDGLSGPKDPVSFTRPELKGNFILGMKHHVLYTALLPTLVKFAHFKIIAVIRHPLDVLASWQKQKHAPLSKGNPPGIAHFWPEALAVMESKAKQLDRLVQLYEMHLQRYHELREQIHIVKYEDVVRDPMIVSRLFDVDALPANASKIKSRPRILHMENAERIRESLKKYGVFAREYYGEV